MPKKTKDVENEIKEISVIEETIGRPSSKTKSKINSKVDKKNSTSKKDATKTKSTSKATTTKEITTSKKSSLKSKKDTTKTTKSSSKKFEVSTTSKDKLKATSTRKTASKAPASEKPLTKKSTAKSKNAKTVKAKSEEVFEYYDLPYRYNETTVKILAQTPKKLFIYWDISEDDRKKYIDEFGLDFFNNTKPVLLIHNDSMNYTFEVEINDFANCWYLDINDTKCEYTIELGRRSKTKNYYIPNNYMYVASSNVIESPNDHILFEKQSKNIYFRNVKNNTIHSKNIANLSFIRNSGKIYGIYDAYRKLYSKMYNDEDIININNPSSMNPTSTFK